MRAGYHVFWPLAVIGVALCASRLARRRARFQNARFIDLPNNCKPIGRQCPSNSAKPHGTLIPQVPARFAAMVKISARYICNGSAVRSPNLNAGIGDVGDITASTFSTLAKSADQFAHLLRAQVIGVVIAGLKT